MDQLDQALRVMAGAAKGIMSAAENDRKSAEEAIAKLEKLDRRIDQHLQQIPKILSDSMARSAESIAVQTTERLLEKFKQADSAAKNAALLYQSASEKLKRRFWLSILATHFGVVMPLALVFFFMVPSTDEIAHRRMESAWLEQNISNLKTRGGTVELVDCQGQLCVRTEELPGAKPLRDTESNEKTYRRVWLPK